MATLPANLQSRRGSLLCKKKSGHCTKPMKPAWLAPGVWLILGHFAGQWKSAFAFSLVGESRVVLLARAAEERGLPSRSSRPTPGGRHPRAGIPSSTPRSARGGLGAALRPGRSWFAVPLSPGRIPWQTSLANLQSRRGSLLCKKKSGHCTRAMKPAWPAPGVWLILRHFSGQWKSAFAFSLVGESRVVLPARVAEERGLPSRSSRPTPGGRHPRAGRKNAPGYRHLWGRRLRMEPFLPALSRRCLSVRTTPRAGLSMVISGQDTHAAGV